MKELFDNFLEKAVWYAYEDYIPFKTQLLQHIFIILPLAVLCFTIFFRSFKWDIHKREKVLKLTAGFVLIFYLLGIAHRLIDNIHYDVSYMGGTGFTWELFRLAWSFELSQMSAVYLIVAVFLIKKPFMYCTAYILGMTSFIAEYAVPYVITGTMPLYHFIHTLSFGMHFFNGLTSLLLISARGYLPKYKDTVKYYLPMAILTMIIINVFAHINDKNYFLVLDPPHIPILSDYLLPPYHNIIFIAALMLGSMIIVTPTKLFFTGYFKRKGIKGYT